MSDPSDQLPEPQDGHAAAITAGRVSWWRRLNAVAEEPLTEPRPFSSGGDGQALSPFPLVERARAEATTTGLVVSPATVEDPFAAPIDFRATTIEEPPVLLDEGSRSLLDIGRRERVFRRLLVAADVLAATATVTVALAGFGSQTIRPLFAVVVPLIVLAAKATGLYDKDELVIDHSTLNELPRLVNLATLFALVMWLGRHYLVGGQPRTVNLLELWLLLIGGLVVFRSLARQLARRIAPAERCLLIGRPSLFEQLGRRIDGLPGVSLVGQLDASELASDHDRVRQIVERNQIHRIIIDTDATGADLTLNTVRLANATGRQVSLLPTILGAVGGSVVFDDIGGLVLMGVPRFGLTRSSRLLKRSFDLVGTGVILLVLAPLLAVIAFAIKLDSSGPVLFRQTRVGRDDTPFAVLKFRSMIDGADALKESLRERNEATGLFKIENDPRITRVGRPLRRTGLDELPQLFNVLAGSMSLVGPRPLVIDEDRRVTGYDRRRLHLTPGITGRWQTLGASRVPLAEMVKIDYLYIANWSPWTDLRIIIETVGHVVRRRGL
jgi:exopolysaccharide biosynthesis polyprenyl glycosylphosphotransferase